MPRRKQPSASIQRLTQQVTAHVDAATESITDRVESMCEFLSAWRAETQVAVPALTGGRNLHFLKMTQGAYRRVVDELGQRRPEAAGVLLGPADNEPLVTHFVLDSSGNGTYASFTLDARFLNQVLAQYRGCGMTCVGIAHSHPTGITAPSMGDRQYLAELFRQTGTEQPFLFPVFCDGQLHPYLALPGERLPEMVPAALVLV